MRRTPLIALTVFTLASCESPSVPPDEPDRLLQLYLDTLAASLPEGDNAYEIVAALRTPMEHIEDEVTREYPGGMWSWDGLAVREYAKNVDRPHRLGAALLALDLAEEARLFEAIEQAASCAHFSEPRTFTHGVIASLEVGRTWDALFDLHRMGRSKLAVAIDADDVDTITRLVRALLVLETFADQERVATSHGSAHGWRWLLIEDIIEAAGNGLLWKDAIVAIERALDDAPAFDTATTIELELLSLEQELAILDVRDHPGFDDIERELIGAGSSAPNAARLRQERAQIEAFAKAAEDLVLPFHQRPGLVPSLEEIAELHDESTQTQFGLTKLHANLEMRDEVSCKWAGARVVLAVARFHSEHGRLPRDLEEAGVDIIDPISGQPFIFEPVGDSFRVYSVWVDGNDDGGTGDQNVLRRAMKGEDLGPLDCVIYEVDESDDWDE